MNKICLIGRTCKDTELNTSGKVATNCIAVDRALKDKDGNKVTDFINLRWLGEKQAKFAQNYIGKGVKIGVTGSLCIENYKDKDGNYKQSVYIMVQETDFCESKGANQQNNNRPAPSGTGNDGFMSIPDGIEDELPFQ